MKVHERVLESALRIGRGRRGWTFRPSEIVAALPDLNPSSVRTHVMSRCCVNAPMHHAHRHAYFKRVRRGVYSVLPSLRSVDVTEPLSKIAFEVRESAGRYEVESDSLDNPVRVLSLDAAVAKIRKLAAGGSAVVDLRLRLEPVPVAPDPVIAAYAKDVDRTLIRENLHLDVEGRLVKLQKWQASMDAVRGAARRRKKR